MNTMNYQMIKETKWILKINLRNYFLKNIILMAGLIQQEKVKKKESSDATKTDEASNDLPQIPQ